MIFPNILLGLLGGILALRMVIWQFFPATEPFFREDFSNIVVACSILLLGILWLTIKALKRRSFKKSGLELPIFIFFAAAAISLFYAPDLPTSLKGVLVLGAQITFFYMLIDLIDTPSRLRWSLIFILGMTFVVSAYGIKTFFDFWTHSMTSQNAVLGETNMGLYYLLVHPRAISFLGWPNILSGYLLLFLPLAILLPFYLRDIRQKILASIGLLLVASCFLYTFSFLGWFSFLLSSIIILPFIWNTLGINTWPKEKKRMIFYCFIAFFILFVLVILRKDFLISLAPRLFYYKAAFTLLFKDPLCGYGWDSFGILCRPMTEDSNDLSGFVHNSYLQIWLETGIIGLLGIALLLVRFFRQAKDSVMAHTQAEDHWIFVAMAWGLIAFLIDNLFSFTLLMPNVSLYWWAMLGIFYAAVKIKKGDDTQPKNQGFLTGTFILILVLMFVVLTRMLGGYMLYYQAMYTKKNNDYISAISMLHQAKVLDPWSSYLPAGEGSLSMAAYSNTRIRSFLSLAAIEYLEAVRRSPKVYYNYFVLGKIYAVLGDNVRAQVFTQKAKELSPAEFDLDNEMFNKSA